MTFRQLEDLVLKLEREVHGNSKKQLLDEISKIYCRASYPDQDEKAVLKKIAKMCEAVLRDMGEIT